MPDVTGGFRLQQCLDAVRGPRLDTYLTADIPRDLAARIRIDPPGPAWAVGGLSEGGFCAARLALRHRSDFGAAAVMDGYFHLRLTPSVRRALYGAAAAPARDDPTALLAALPAGPPVPAFWLMAGTGNAHDYREAITFATALGRREDLRFLTVIGGRHTTPAWQAAFPDLPGGRLPPCTATRPTARALGTSDGVGTTATRQRPPTAQEAAVAPPNSSVSVATAEVMPPRSASS